MAFPAEIAPSQGIQPSGITLDTSLRPEFSPRPEINVPYAHPLQERIANEWKPLLAENGEGCPARRLSVVVDQADKFAALTNGLSTQQLDGDMDEQMMDDVIRHTSYLKTSVLTAATALRIDVGSFVERKMFEKMQVKYPPDSVYQLIRSGMEPLEAMAYLKDAYNNGVEPRIPHFEISPEEEEARLPRKPVFEDPYQDVTDVWQRRAFGIFLKPGERLPNLSGEITEFLDEFKVADSRGGLRNMTEGEVNALSGHEGTVTAHDEEGVDGLQDKLILIGGEAADVVIAVDGYAAGLGRDQHVDANAALDRTIDRYKKTKRLVRLGMQESEAMNLLREVHRRQKSGHKMPYISLPAAAAVIFG